MTGVATIFSKHCLRCFSRKFELIEDGSKMSDSSLRLPCGKCGEILYGQADLHCHMMMSHRNNLQMVSTPFVDGYPRGQNVVLVPYIDQGLTSSVRDVPLAEKNERLERMEKCLNAIQTAMESMKDGIAENRENIAFFRTSGNPRRCNGHSSAEKASISARGLGKIEFEELPNGKYEPQDVIDFFKVVDQLIQSKDFEGTDLETEHKAKDIGHQSNQTEEDILSIKKELFSMQETLQEHQQGCMRKFDQIQQQLKKQSDIINRDTTKEDNFVIVRLKKQLKESQDKIKQLYNLVDKEKDSNKQLTEKNKQLKMHVSSVRNCDNKEQSNSEKVKEKYLKEIESLQSKCKELQEMNLELRKESEEEKNKCTQYRDAKNELKRKCIHLQRSLKCSESSVKEIQEELKQQKKEKKEQQEDANKKQMTLQKLKEEIGELKEEKELADHRMRDMIHELDLSRGEIMKKDFLESQIADLEKEKERLKLQLTESNEQQTLLREEVADLEKCVTQFKEENCELQDQLKTIKKDKNEMEEKFAALDSQADEAEKNCLELRKRLEMSTESNNSLETEKMKMKKTISEMEEQQSKLQKRVDEVENLKSSTSKEYEEIRQRLEAKEKENVNQSKTLDEVQLQSLQLKETTTNLQNDLDETEKELRAKESALIGLNVKNMEQEDEIDNLKASNEELLQEIDALKDSCADYTDLMQKSRQRIAEIEGYKREIDQLRKGDRQNIESLSTMVREGKRLGEEIGRLEEEKAELRKELDEVKDQLLQKECLTPGDMRDDDPRKDQLAAIVVELNALIDVDPQKAQSNNDGFEMISIVKSELESRTKKIDELSCSVHELETELEKLRQLVADVERKKNEENDARKQSEAKVAQLQFDLEELKKAQNDKESGEINTLKNQLQYTKEQKIKLEEELDKIYSERTQYKKTLQDANDHSENAREELIHDNGDKLKMKDFADEMVVEEIDFGDEDDYVEDLIISDDELFNKKPNQPRSMVIDDFEDDFYRSSSSTSCDANDNKNIKESNNQVMDQFPHGRLAPLTRNSNLAVPPLKESSLTGFPLQTTPKVKLPSKENSLTGVVANGRSLSSLGPDLKNAPAGTLLGPLPSSEPLTLTKSFEESHLKPMPQSTTPLEKKSQAASLLGPLPTLGPPLQKTSLLGPLPSLSTLSKPSLTAAKPKAEKKKSKKKSGNVEGKTKSSKKGKKVPKKHLPVEEVDDDDDVEFTNDDINNLLDNL